jgi:hypothetical protein
MGCRRRGPGVGCGSWDGRAWYQCVTWLRLYCFAGSVKNCGWRMKDLKEWWRCCRCTVSENNAATGQAPRPSHSVLRTSHTLHAPDTGPHCIAGSGRNASTIQTQVQAQSQPDPIMLLVVSYSQKRAAVCGGGQQAWELRLSQLQWCRAGYHQNLLDK